MTRRIYLLLAAVLLYPVSAVSQMHPDQGYTDLKKGTIFLYERSDKGDFLLRFERIKNGLYEFQAHRVDGEKSTFERTIFRNSRGQTVRMEWPNGKQVRYEPHDCRYVVGECSYVFYDRKGVPGEYRSSGSWSGATYRQVTEILRGAKYAPFSDVRFKFDKNGLEVSRNVRQGKTRGKIKLKRFIPPE
jgi:hypothetical protein